MFENLKTYNKIFVCGLARSGTRACSKMIAQDTGLEFIDETEWGVLDFNNLKFHDKYRTNFVIQANGAYWKMPFFSRDNTLVVFVKRDLKDIQKSWDRINKLKSINRMWSPNPPIQLLVPLEKRLEIWDGVKLNIKNLLEVNYEDLKEHPLWEKDRDEFLWQQTSSKQFTEEERKIMQTL